MISIFLYLSILVLREKPSDFSPLTPSQSLELAAGKKLYETRCISCHALKNPLATSKEKWIKILPRMVRKAKLKEDEKNLIQSYIFSLDLK